MSPDDVVLDTIRKIPLGGGGALDLDCCSVVAAGTGALPLIGVGIPSDRRTPLHSSEAPRGPVEAATGVLLRAGRPGGYA